MKTYSYQIEFQNLSILKQDIRIFSLNSMLILIRLMSAVSFSQLEAGIILEGPLFYHPLRETLFKWNAEAAKGTFYNGDIQYVTGPAWLPLPAIY
jgi:hypothetical protein